MARTQIGSDLIQNNSIKIEDLADSVNAQGAKEPKIYRISKQSSNFHEINYAILNLFPKRFFVQGELRKVEWYIDNALTDLCLIAEMVYTRDYLGFATGRVTTRTWVNNDGSLNPYTSVSVKDYLINDGESTKEGRARRQALVDNIEKPVLGAMHEVLIPMGWDSIDILMNGRNFLDEYDVEFGKFIKHSSTVTKKSDPNYGKKKVVVKLEQETYFDYVVWLDTPLPSLDGNTIREHLILEFTI